MTAHDRLIVTPGGRLTGSLMVPGDKSISHRAVMFGAIARGETVIEACLMGDDVRATINAFRAMGVAIEAHDDGRVVIDGRGANVLREPDQALDMGNSGTSIRLLTGLLAGLGIRAQLGGDASLNRRPMRRVTEPLALMGADIATTDAGTPPLQISSGAPLRGIRYELPVASAQVKSAILLAGLNATGETCVVERLPSRDHTERMLRAFGVQVEVQGLTVGVRGGQPLTGTHIPVPGDISSAAFFLVGAAMSEGASLRLENIGINPTRTGVIDILRLMGADIELTAERAAGAEPVADIIVRGRRLHGVDIPAALVPSAIDEFPALFIAAANADGTTRLGQADELRHKESDRIDAMASGLQELGVVATPLDDGIEIVGRPGALGGGAIDSRGDHRIAMAFAVAGMLARAPIALTGCAAIATSFPGFVETARRAGMNISVAK
jgi:3-phosphoshikimate 1-carboxyvinyltransferase